LLIPVQDVHSMLPALKARIQANQAVLANFVAQYGHLLRKRGHKKTVAQRRAILLATRPQIASGHRPDMGPVVFTGCPQIRAPSDYAHHTPPFINLEDLSTSKSLLLLLESRGSYAPHVFAYSDFELAPLARLRSRLLEDTLYTLNFLDSYADVVKWPNEQEAKASIAQGLTMHPMHGLQVLRMHDDLLDFLQKLCRVALSDVLPADSASNQPDITRAITDTASTLTPTENESRINTFWDTTRELPYRIPMVLDLSRMLQLVEIRTEAAEDHIWMLRQDPAYFTDVVESYTEHRPEHLPYNCNDFHALTNKCELLTKTLRNSITDAYVDLFTWHQLQERLANLIHLETISAANTVDSSEELPPPFFDVLVKTWFFLENTILDLVYQLFHAWPASPAARPYYLASCKYSCKHRITAEQHHKEIYENVGFDMVDRLISYLESARLRNAFGVHTIVDALGNFMQTGEWARAQISPLIASYLSQLSVASQCLRQLQLYQPWARQLQQSVESRKAQLFIEYAVLYARWHETLMTSFSGTNLWFQGRPGEKFDYPFDQPVTESNTNKMRAAEVVLDKFWAEADAHFRLKTGTTPHDLVADIISDRTIFRTPTWGERLKSNLELVPVSFHETNKQITGAFTPAAIPVKIKTHSLTSPAEAMPAPQTVSVPLIEQPQIIFVKKQSLKTLRALFYDKSSSGTTEVPWLDFVRAMVSVGFSAIKTQGSKWQFLPLALTSNRSISIHKPHPAKKLSNVQARRIGFRLNNKYGWTRGTFRLASK
jgi:hypothetical protein